MSTVSQVKKMNMDSSLCQLHETDSAPVARVETLRVVVPEAKSHGYKVLKGEYEDCFILGYN